MFSQQRAEERKLPAAGRVSQEEKDIVTSNQTTSGSYDGYSVKSTMVVRKPTKIVTKQIEEQDNEKPAASPIFVDMSVFDEDIKSREYARRILLADSMGRKESDRISDEARRELIRSTK